MDTPHEEREALIALLSSDGWTLFEKHIESEWGPVAYARKLDRAVAEARTARESAEDAILELTAQQRAVNAARQWPQKRIEELKESKDKRPFATWRRV